MATPRKSADQWFAEYGESHQDHTNETIHWICVPCIFFSVLGLLGFICACYILVEGLVFLGWLPVWKICLGLFVAAWIGQFIGHKIEGEKPSFLKDVVFLLIGPAWLLHFIYKKLDIAY
jgi:uncharacterized membrane protein YGL010W